MRGSFDHEKFFSALDLERALRRLTWKDVSTQAKVSASSLTRMSQGKRPDVDTLAALFAWSGLKADEYMAPQVERQNVSSPLPQICELLRSDEALTQDGAAAIEEILKSSYQQFRKK